MSQGYWRNVGASQDTSYVGRRTLLGITPGGPSACSDIVKKTY